MHQEKLNLRKIRIIDFISFLIGFSQSILAYVMSSYFKEALGTDNIGGFYVVSYLVNLIIFLNLHKLVRRFGKSQMLFGALLLQLVALFGLMAVPASLGGAIMMMSYIIFSSTTILGLDMILETFSTDQMSGRIRGFRLAIMNLGWVFGPMTAAVLLESTGFSAIFSLMLGFGLVATGVAFLSLRGVNHNIQSRQTIIGLVIKAWHYKDIMRIYSISFILDFFYGVMVIYAPIYLRNLGFSWSEIGLMFTMMLTTFVIIPYPLGIIADEKISEKKLLYFSLSIMGAATLAIYFIDSVNIYVWAIILFLTRVGAAATETLRDSYFFKKIDGEDVDLIDFFRTSAPLAYMIASAVSIVVVRFYSLRLLFLIVAIFIFSGLYITSKLTGVEIIKAAVKEKIEEVAKKKKVVRQEKIVKKGKTVKNSKTVKKGGAVKQIKAKKSRR